MSYHPSDAAKQLQALILKVEEKTEEHGKLAASLASLEIEHDRTIETWNKAHQKKLAEIDAERRAAIEAFSKRELDAEMAHKAALKELADVHTLRTAQRDHARQVMESLKTQLARELQKQGMLPERFVKEREVLC